MYSIRWYENDCIYQLIGEFESIIQVADMLEKRKIKFKVADVRGFLVDQVSLDCGDFKYWMTRDEKF